MRATRSLFCLVGSLLALSGFASVQDRQIAAAIADKK